MKHTARGGAFLFVAIVVFCFSAFAQPDSSAPGTGSLTIQAGQKFIMQLETPMHSRTTKKGDKVEFVTAGDVLVENQVVIPAKSLVRGTVSLSKRAGRLFGRAEIHLRFEDVKLADGSILPLKATITRVGFDPVDPQKKGEDPKIQAESGGGGADAKTIASASAQGAIIGVLSGGLNGAMYGAAAGAAIAVTQAALKRGPDIDLPRSTMFEARFDTPLSIPEKSVEAAQKAATAASERQAQTARNSRTENAAGNQQTADASSGPAPEYSPDEEKVTAKRPVLKRRKPSSDDVAVSEEPAPPAAEAPADSPGDSPAKASPQPPARASADIPLPESTIPTISVKVRMVQVDAVVRDRSGRMMDNLRIEDFRVYEDGVLQQIQSFSRDELPISVALVVDRSGSVAPYISELRKIAVRALNQLKPGDQVCLFSFAADVYRVEDLTTDRNRIAYALDSIQAGGSTDITGALYEAVKYLSRSAPGQRHAIILVSDNQQTVHSMASESETAKMAMESETVIYSLKTSGMSLPLGTQLPSIIFGGSSVGKIAQETGGEIINVSNVSSLDSALGAVVSRLRMRYSLGYYPSGTAQGGAFHEIKVRLDERFGKPGSDYFMHAKRGYYATGGSLDRSATGFDITHKR